MNKKSDILAQDLEARLRTAALKHVFQNPTPIIEGFLSIFEMYGFDQLHRMSENNVDALVKNMSTWKKVKELQQLIQSEVYTGRHILEGAVTPLIANVLKTAGIVPPNRMHGFSFNSYDEVKGELKGEQKKFTAYVGKDFSEDMTEIAPDSVVYGSGIQWVKNGQGQIILPIEEGTVRKTAKIIEFKDTPTEDQAERRVREVMDKIRVNRMGFSNKDLEWEVAKQIAPYFPDIIRKREGKNMINYARVHKLFRLVRRRNLILGEYLKNKDFSSELEESISKTIALPYGIVRVRTKAIERTADKMVEAIYNLTSDPDQGKEFKDMYGVRVILGDVRAVFEFFKVFKKIPFVEMVDAPEDFIKNPKPNGYRSLHAHFSYFGRTYALQVRDHEMDFKSENDPLQSHDGEYLDSKFKFLEERTSPAVRQLIKLCLGIPVGKGSYK